MLSFVLWSFQVLGKDLMDYGTRSGKSLSLGMPKAPQGKIQGQPKILSLGMPRKASPLLSSSIGNFTWSYIFYSSHDMCFAWSVLYDISLCFLVYHNHPCCTHLLRDTHIIQNLLEYSMCFTYIFWAKQFCSSASLISFRARRWLNFEKNIDLSCFTYIILRVS